jgi:hypothetical protein
VWVRHPAAADPASEKLWALATIEAETDGGMLTVSSAADGVENLSVPRQSALPANDRSGDDMTQLLHINEPALLHNLAERFRGSSSARTSSTSSSATSSTQSPPVPAADAPRKGKGGLGRQPAVPYTFLGTVLVVVNPLRFLPSPPSAAFMDRALEDNPPHPFAIAEQAYLQVRDSNHTTTHSTHSPDPTCRWPTAAARLTTL